MDFSELVFAPFFYMKVVNLLLSATAVGIVCVMKEELFTICIPPKFMLPGQVFAYVGPGLTTMSNVAFICSILANEDKSQFPVSMICCMGGAIHLTVVVYVTMTMTLMVTLQHACTLAWVVYLISGLMLFFDGIREMCRLDLN